MKKNTFIILGCCFINLSYLAANPDTPQIEESCMQDCVDQLLDEIKMKVSNLAHNDTVVMNTYDTFAKNIHRAYHQEKSLSASQVQNICYALEFAAQKHRLQTRKNPEKTPYIAHPIGVTNYVLEIGEIREESVIIASLLHDTVEDTQTTFEEIEEKFGKEVTNFVREMTDDKSLAMETRKRLQIINASTKSSGAAQIKLADKLYNLNDLLTAPPADWSQLRIDHYYEWVQSVVDRLPKVNEKLLAAVEGSIKTYWDAQNEKILASKEK